MSNENHPDMHNTGSAAFTAAGQLSNDNPHSLTRVSPISLKFKKQQGSSKR